MSNVLDRRDARGERDARAVSLDPVVSLVPSPWVSRAPLVPLVYPIAFVSLLLLAFVSAAFADTVDVTVRRAPYTVGGASTKSEIARYPCKYCGSKTSYNRTYKWDYDRHVWNETTKTEDIPVLCRKCRQKERDQEKLNRKERKLDADIEYQRTRLRIKDKKQELEALRKEAR